MQYCRRQDSAKQAGRGQGGEDGAYEHSKLPANARRAANRLWWDDLQGLGGVHGHEGGGAEEPSIVRADRRRLQLLQNSFTGGKNKVPLMFNIHSMPQWAPNVN